MIDYNDIWCEAYFDAIEEGSTKTEASFRAYDVAQNWSERQQAKAEAMEDR